MLPVSQVQQFGFGTHGQRGAGHVQRRSETALHFQIVQAMPLEAARNRSTSARQALILLFLLISAKVFVDWLWLPFYLPGP